MARGGARVGSGRKPKRPVTLTVLDGGAAALLESGGPSVVPPEDLPADQREFWQQYAHLAIEKRTLTVHTVPAFRLLCELEAEKKAVKRQIETDGRTYLKITIDGAGQEHQEVKAHPLKADYAKLAKHVQNLLEKFTLGPFGKPIVGTMKTKAEQQKADTRAKFFGGARG